MKKIIVINFMVILFNVIAIVCIERQIKNMKASHVEMPEDLKSYNELMADDAYARAIDCVKDQKKEMAKVYCLNAINHAPTKIKYFQKLFEIYTEGGSEKISDKDLEQLRGILETGIYQVPGQDVAAIHQMLAQVITRQSTDEEQSSNMTSEERPNAFAASQAVVKTGELAWDKIDESPDDSKVEVLHRRMAVLNVLAESVLEGAGNDEQWLQDELRKTKLAIEYYMQTASIISYLDRAEGILNVNTNKMEVVSVLTQTANQLLSQTLGMDEKLLPHGAPDLLHDFAKRIANIEKRFNYIRSKNALADIERIFSEIETPYETNFYEYTIQQIANGIKMITQQLSFVYDLEEKVKVENRLTSISQRLAQLREQQYVAYQKWAISQCESAFAKYRSWTRVDEKDAREVINLYLINIDSTLLTPDVNRLYQDILGKQLAELGTKQLADMEIKMAREEKKSLKDF